MNTLSEYLIIFTDVSTTHNPSPPMMTNVEDYPYEPPPDFIPPPPPGHA